MLDSVCQKCNQFFGDELELRFARGAFEGMLRYQNGVKAPPEGAINLQYVEFAVPEGKGYWSGVRLNLVNEGNGLRVGLVPQAAFFDQDQQRWIHVTEEEFNGGFLTKRPDLKKGQMRIHTRSRQEHEAFVSKLSEHGVKYEQAGELQPSEDVLEASEMEVDVTFTINQGIRRCIAKYVFNYLALVAGSEFVRERDFDVVRDYIRHGASLRIHWLSKAPSRYCTMIDPHYARPAVTFSP